jgi:hypothetical protein
LAAAGVITRAVVLAVAVLFIVVFAGLTLSVLSEGITLGGLLLIALAVGVLIVLGIGIVGALRKPPNE